MSVNQQSKGPAGEALGGPASTGEPASSTFQTAQAIFEQVENSSQLSQDP